MWDHGPVVVSGASDPEVLRPRVDYATGRLVPGYHHDWASRGHFVQVDVAYGLTNRLTVVGSWPLVTARTLDHLYIPGGAVANHTHGGTTISRVDLTTRAPAMRKSRPDTRGIRRSCSERRSRPLPAIIAVGTRRTASETR